MSYIKPDLNERFAENATAPTDIDKPASSTMLGGWLFGEKPPHKWFNWLLNKIDNALSNLNERGVLDWDAVTTYNKGSMVWSGEKVYKSRTNSNLNNAVTSTTNWQEQSLPDMPTSGDGYILYYSGSKLFWKSHYDLDYGAYEGRVASNEKSYIMVNDNVIGNDPLATEINVGELACNFKDRTLFTKTPEGAIVPLSGQASIVDFEFLVTADTQVTFQPAGGYTTNQIEVFVNGRKIGKNEFTANDGVNVTFTGLTPVKDDLVVISVWASFGISDAYTQTQTDALLATLRADRAGITFDFAGAVAPTGSLECNGQVVLKADYPELYSAIGDLWATTGGAGTPLATEFRLPPQAIGGIGLFTRGKGAVGIGVYQADVFKAHNHIHGIRATNSAYVNKYGTVALSGTDRITGDTTNPTISGYTQTVGDATETRPRSITMMKCIWTGK